MTSFRDRAGYSGYRGAVSLAQALPFSVTRRVAFHAAAAYWASGAKHVRFARENLRHAFPDMAEADRDAIGRTSIQNFARSILDLARSEAWSLDQVLAMHKIEGISNLDQALSLGKGAIVLAPHMGNFELGIRALSGSGYKVTAVARRARNPIVDQWLCRHRQEGGAEVVDHRGAAPRILRALRRGRIVPLLIDQYVRREQGVWAPLFGVRASTSTSVAILSMRSGCPVVPMYTVREGCDEHRVVVSEPILAPTDRTDVTGAVLEMTTRFNQSLEAAIRLHPEQWVWAHRRFRHSPDLAERPYR